MVANHLLGLSCGQPRGSAEILLKAALIAAEATGAVVEMVRLEELHLPSGPDRSEPDDAWWHWERLIACDGLIISSPIMSRTVAARLTLLGDRLLGPNADAATIEHLVAAGQSDHEPSVAFRVDERVLRPRVAGFLAVGGSLASQWKTLALPIMHTMTFSMSIAVAAYLGEPGVCPMCHLDVIVLRGRAVECATCGARGRLRADVTVHWTDLTTSVIGMADRRAHAAELQSTAQRHHAVRDEIERRAAEYDGYDRLARPS